MITVLSGRELAGCHLAGERELLKKYASVKKKLVEIGVFDGGFLFSYSGKNVISWYTFAY